MNEYVLHEQLLALESIAGHYAGGEQACAQIRDTVERIKTQRYRVAVIGEFKRGKSSLINAIIGAEVLPTDILPMTAAVTRVTYGEKRRILVRYKDDTTEERTVEELVDFATKYDAEKEKVAASIREIEVTYPSVFCKNHIDILDTPGLNDNESMTEVTLSVLGDVDAAIMVISAKAPLSLTEQNLILDMISRPQIRHIIFVVTHIDAISSRASQQDKMIRFIRDRLSGELLEKAEEQFQEKPEFLEKSKYVLEKPDIFGVSSVLAMDGFNRDDEDLLEESRFPYFKKELLALLTAAQTGDVKARTLENACDVRDRLEGWYEEAKTALEGELETLKTQRQMCQDFYTNCSANMTRLLQEMDMELGRKGIRRDMILAPDLEGELKRPFFQEMSTITPMNNTDFVVRQAIGRAAANAKKAVEAVSIHIESRVREAAMNMLDGYMLLREPCGFQKEEFAKALEAWNQQSFPQFRWSVSLFPQVAPLRVQAVIPHIHFAVSASMRAYAQAVNHFVGTWRVLMLKQSDRDKADRSPLTSAEPEYARIRSQMELLTQRHEANRGRLGQVLTALQLDE